MFDARQFAASLARRQDRWSLLKNFVAEWHSPFTDGDGYSAEEIKRAERESSLMFPVALSEWYQLGGKREDLTCTDPYQFYGPDGLEVDKSGGICIFSETQAGVDWAIRHEDFHLADPPIYFIGDDAGLGSGMANRSFSEFALQVVIHQTTCFPRIGGNAHGEDDTAKIVARNFQALGLPDWHWPTYPARLYGGDDVLIELDTNSEGYCWLWVAARNDAALDEATQLLDLDWVVLYDENSAEKNDR